MANTTNFNWETPDDTDLVKDGAAAIRTLGSAIDTSLVDLKGGTTGQVLSKTSNTDMDFTWVAQDDSNAIQNAIVDAKGDIVAASAADTPARLAVGTDNYRLVAASGETTGLKYVADTQNTVIDAAGDLLYGTAADTLGRLAIGTAGQVLKVNSGATAPEWGAAGGGSTTATFTDEKASGTDGGTFTSGAWRTRDLNTTVFNNITSCSLSSNQISLPAGTYIVNAQAPAFDISQGQTRLYNITDSTTTIAGASTYCAAGSSDATAPSLVLGAFTIAGTKTFELQHRAGETQATNGFGVATGFGVNNVYSQITITKVG
jgi:hypothetical protein